MLLDSIKYILILLTAFLAIWSVFHDYKTDRRINKKGWAAVAVLITLCITSILAEYISGKNKAIEDELAAAQLKMEIKQQETLLLKLTEVDQRILSNVSYLEALKKEISANHFELKTTQNSIHTATDIQVEQQKAIDVEIRRFSEKAG